MNVPLIHSSMLAMNINILLLNVLGDSNSRYTYEHDPFTF